MLQTGSAPLPGSGHIHAPALTSSSSHPAPWGWAQRGAFAPCFAYKGHGMLRSFARETWHKQVN